MILNSKMGLGEITTDNCQKGIPAFYGKNECSFGTNI